MGQEIQTYLERHMWRPQKGNQTLGHTCVLVNRRRDLARSEVGRDRLTTRFDWSLKLPPGRIHVNRYKNSSFFSVTEHDVEWRAALQRNNPYRNRSRGGTIPQK